MSVWQKVVAAAAGFAKQYDPYGLADLDGSHTELVYETVELLLTEPRTVLDYFER